MVLREVVDDDVAIFFEHQRDAAASRMAAFMPKAPPEREAFFARWARMLRRPDVLVRTIARGADVVGHVATFLRDGELEVTYWIGRAYWGNGLATRALEKFLREDEKRRPLVGRAAADNFGSVRVLEKCGFVHVARVRSFAEARGAEIDEVVMRLE